MSGQHASWLVSGAPVEGEVVQRPAGALDATESLLPSAGHGASAGQAGGSDDDGEGAGGQRQGGGSGSPGSAAGGSGDALHADRWLKHHWRRERTSSQEPVSATLFAQVITRARRHDEAALETLYERAFPVIYRYVLARLGRPELVEDVVAEVFLVMLESIGTLRAEHEAGFYAWLIRIAQGKSALALQQRQHSEARLVPLPEQAEPELEEGRALTEPVATDLASDPAAVQEWRETLQEVGLALASLTTEQQIVVVGRFLAGQRIEDLARALQKQPGAVRALQFRALGTLAERLGFVGTVRPNGKGGRT